MGSHAFLVDSEGDLKPLQQAPFERERQLDNYVEQYPQLLASALSTEGADLQFVLVETQAAIDDSDGDKSGRWAADAIFLDQTGTLTIVEDKLSSNPEVRRKIVGQMIEYAANILEAFTADGVQQRLARTHDDVEDALALLFGQSDVPVSDSVDTLWDNVQRNLQAGVIRLAFVADHLPHELRRTIEFLNQYMNPVEVVGVQISRMRDGSEEGAAEVLVTSVVGRTERRPRPSQPSGKQTPISRDEFFHDFDAIGDDSGRSTAVRRLAEELWNSPELFSVEAYRTPRVSSRCVFASRADGRKLVSIVANRRRNRCGTVVSYERWKWPEPLIKSLEDLMGFRPGPLGLDVGEWCGQSDSNTQTMIEWIRRAALG